MWTNVYTIRQHILGLNWSSPYSSFLIFNIEKHYKLILYIKKLLLVIYLVSEERIIINPSTWIPLTIHKFNVSKFVFWLKRFSVSLLILSDSKLSFFKEKQCFKIAFNASVSIEVFVKSKNSNFKLLIFSIFWGYFLIEYD